MPGPESHQQPNPEQNLTPDQRKIRGIFNGSFFFSQGNADQQNKILFWAIQKGHFNGIDLPIDPPEYILQMPLPPRHVPLELPPSNQLALMYDGFQNMKHQYDQRSSLQQRYYEDHDLIEELTGEMIARDFAYQTTKVRLGREPIEQPPQPDSSNDTRASLLRRFVINGQSTGIDALDQMCGEIREYLIDDIELERATSYTSPQEPKRTAIGKLQQEWEKNHPGEKFFSVYEAQLEEKRRAAEYTQQFELEVAVFEPQEKNISADPEEPPVGKASGESIAGIEDGPDDDLRNGGTNKGKSK